LECRWNNHLGQPVVLDLGLMGKKRMITFLALAMLMTLVQGFMTLDWEDGLVLILCSIIQRISPKDPTILPSIRQLCNLIFIEGNIRAYLGCSINDKYNIRF
jgi:hypothetical protein